MENVDFSEKRKTKNLWTIIGWIVGIGFVISGLVTVFSDFVQGLFLIFLALLLIKPTYTLLVKKFQFLSKRWVRPGVAILFLLVILIAQDPAQSTDNGNNQIQPVAVQENQVAQVVQPQTPPVQKTSEQILKDNLSQIVHRTGTTDFSYIGLDIEKADSDRPVGSKMVTAKVNVSNFFSRSTLIKDTGKLSTAVFQEMFTSKLNIEDMLVWFYSETEDRYGNKKDSVVIVYAIDRGTYKKVNWANFDSGKLCDFLVSEEKITGLGSGPACNVLANIE